MSQFPEQSDERDWSPVTSRPGEIHTVEGQVRTVGRLAYGLKHRDPRGRPYRRSMQRAALWCVAVAAAVFAGALLFEALR